ncbi:glycoside hydrolase family 16 protein [Pedobacter sp. SYP-B3415]|uniref:glycoside hydrolase family 16 protein n=1 Tax=Pedobacter sp. SYP-B3415 TaxID=2496641 RepID=UPI0013EC29AD|nr:glycoside hydrolase family 16 protein [Pedobacter sp. SYP-B3415]
MLLSCSTGTEVIPEPETLPPPQVPDQPVIIYPGYELAWHDEFNGTAIDETKWTLETGTGVNGDFGTGQLDRATGRAENARIEKNVEQAGSCLAVSTRKEQYQDRNYTSARLNTRGKAAFGPGYRIEARIWARDVRFKGQGFAFWLMPEEKTAAGQDLMWPQGGEIDIMEYVGSVPYHNLGGLHYAWFWENNQYRDWNHAHKATYFSFAQSEVPAVKPAYGGWPAVVGNPDAGSSRFFTYRADWHDDRIEFSIDNQVYHVHYFDDGRAFDNGKPDGQDQDGLKTISGKRTFISEYSNHFTEWDPFRHRFYLILSAGVGGNDNQTYGGAIVPEAIFPCTVYVDWVRVHKRI